jgi:hypothetical protein
MEIEVLLPIAAFIALAAGLAVVLRGTGKIVARTREVEHFRSAVKDLAARVDVSLGGAAGQIDAVRRRQVDPDLIGDTLIASMDAVRRYADEARGLRGPRQSQRIREDLVAELERAERALEMVEHGASIMVTVRRGPRELEAQTAIKRGYLNLIHAREAFARRALDAEEMTVDDTTVSASR